MKIYITKRFISNYPTFISIIKDDKLAKIIEYVDDIFIDLVNKNYDTNVLKGLSINVPKEYILVDIDRSFAIKDHKKNKLLIDIKLPPTKWKMKKVKFLDKPLVSFLNT